MATVGVIRDFGLRRGKFLTQEGVFVSELDGSVRGVGETARLKIHEILLSGRSVKKNVQVHQRRGGCRYRLGGNSLSREGLKGRRRDVGPVALVKTQDRREAPP